jgi:hypothetical protein
VFEDFESQNAPHLWPLTGKSEYVPGHVGKHALRISYDVKQFTPTGLFLNVGPSQDWSHFHSIHFWMHGSNTGSDISLAIQNVPHQGEGSINHPIRDDFTGWRQFRIPFSAFKINKPKSPSDKFDFQKISMVTFMLIPNRALSSSFQLDHIELLDHELLADPPER